MCKHKQSRRIPILKIKFLLVILVSLLTIGFSSTTSKSVAEANVVKSIQSIEVNVNKCNVTFENGTTDSIEFTYWGTASSSIYSINDTLEENVQKITVMYTGDIPAPTNKEGGLIIKIPDKEFQLLSIAGKYSGITLDNMKMDVNLITRGASVIMTDDSPNNISIDSTYDSYSININPITEDFHLKEKGSLIELQFCKEPSNLHFNIIEENEGKSELPKNWKADFLIGTGKPEMKIENNKGIFRLSIIPDVAK